MSVLYTFGDSILDCAHYNREDVSPGQLLVTNRDDLFPEFRGRDLTSHVRGVRLEHRAIDGGTVDSLPYQLRGFLPADGAALLTVGGNDLLRGLILDEGPGFRAFERKLTAFFAAMPVRPLLVGNVYDPTGGDDTRNFTGISVARARASHRRLNELLATLTERAGGQLVDLHTHFLGGDASWFVSTIEPSLVGASEVRRCFWEALAQHAAFGLSPDAVSGAAT